MFTDKLLIKLVNMSGLKQIHTLYCTLVILFIVRLCYGKQGFTICNYKFSENGTNVPVVR